MNVSEAVKDFHTKFSIRKAHPTDSQAMRFRMKLIAEEFLEVIQAAGFGFNGTEVSEWRFIPGPCFPPGLEEASRGAVNANLLKELADLAYVIYGTAEALGWDLDEAIKRVHASNMSKIGADGKPIYRSDGKVLKGPTYKEPDLTDLV